MKQPNPRPLILFSGLAADAEVFVPQKVAFPQLVVPKWPIPEPNDTLDTYCDRLADELRVHSAPIIGGASFGGIIALHVAQRLNPSAILLIGSVRSPAEFPYALKFARPLRPLVRLIPVRLIQACCAPMASKLARRLTPHFSGLARQFRGADPTVFKWSIARLMDWNSTPTFTCPIFKIHGDRDFVLPLRFTQSDAVVRGGGHVISLTHPTEVNNWIRAVTTQIADGCGD